MRDQLGTIRVPTQVVAGALDDVAPPSMAGEVAAGITSGGGTATAVSLEGVAHLAPFEAPGHVAELLQGPHHLDRDPGSGSMTLSETGRPNSTGPNATVWSSPARPARRSTTAA